MWESVDRAVVSDEDGTAAGGLEVEADDEGSGVICRRHRHVDLEQEEWGITSRTLRTRFNTAVIDNWVE